MRNWTILFLSLLTFATMQAQSVNDADPVLMTITAADGQGEAYEVRLSEFMYIYEKNNQDAAVEKKNLDEYLELFTNFKLKVLEAMGEGIDTTEAFRKELQGYRAQAIPRYMQDDEAVDSLILMSYQRMAKMRRAAHIVLECKASASDSLKNAAMAQIQEIRQQAVKDKAHFYQLADRYSEDPNVRESHGELGWITPFRYVYALENAVYNTPVGEVTEVFQSPYGLHIALVEEEIPTEEVHAAHIMKMTQGKVDAAVAKQQIDSIYNLLLQGADFAETAKSASDDKGSALRGGDLSWFGKGMMVKPFEDAAFSLPVGGMSEPFLSQFGWHITKVYERRGIQPFDSLKADIRRKVERDERMNAAAASFIRKTRQEYNLPAEMTDDEVVTYADAHLEEKYPNLRYLVNEYHDGILLFEVSLKTVWDKAGKDEKGLTAYFRAHKKDFRWDEPRYKGYIIYAKTQEAAQRAKTIVKTANPDSIQSYIDHRINNDSVTLVRIEKGTWKAGHNSAVDKYGFKVKNAKYENEKYPYVMAVGKVLKQPETYMDERGKVTSAYQDELEKVWVAELRKKYLVTIDHSLLHN